jgi:metal-responsive CopG/Arc/MetJ family transcriptional regulator
MRVLGTKVKDDIAEEFERLARKQGISKSELLRLVILEYLKEDKDLRKELDRIRKRIRKEQKKRNEFCRKLYAELGKVGSNINQIARYLNLNKGGRAVSHLTDLVIETMDLITELKLRLKDGDSEKDT